MLKVQNQHHLKIVPSSQISTIPLRHYSRFPVSPPQSKDLFSSDHVLEPGQISVPDSSMMDKLQTVTIFSHDQVHRRGINIQSL